MSRDPGDRDEVMREALRDQRTNARYDATAPGAAPGSPASPAGRTTERARSRSMRWGAAASIAATALSIVLGWQVVQHRRALAVATSERHTLIRLVAQLEEEIATLERRSGRLAEALERAEQKKDARPDALSATVARVLATMRLAPGAVRGEAKSVVVRAPPGPGTIRLQLDLGAVAGRDAYRAIIATANGRAVWSSGALAPEGVGAARRLTLDAPANALEPGVYELSLRADGSSEDLAHYYFQMARR